MKREVALKGDAFALTELLSRITEMASTVTLMGALAGKVRDPIQSEYGAMALRVGLGQKAEYRRLHASGDRTEKFCYNLLDDGACRKADCKFSHVPRCPKDRKGRCDDKSCKLAHDSRQAQRKDRQKPATPPRSGRAERSAVPRSCFNCGDEGHVQRNCPKPKKVTAEGLATDTGADAGEDSYRQEHLSH